ncbi:MAG: histidine--tRNA ligase [Actinomycetes bacterium]
MSGIQAPRGTFDLLPEVSADYLRIEKLAGRILGRAGYRRIDTPIFESTDLFERGVGASTDIVGKEMYSFDDGGGRSMTLRPEGTAPICRSYIEHGMHKLQQPVRLWYSGPFFRHENPQAGRFRQFRQVGAEALGSDSPLLDAESILLLAELLEAAGVGGTTLRISSLGSPERRAAYRDQLISFLRSKSSELSAEVVARIDSNPLRAFDSSDPSTIRVMEAAPRLLDSLDSEDRDHFDTVCGLLDGAGLSYEVDTSLVRGLDYYTRTVFEFTSTELGAQSGVGGGGRYDRLVAMLGGQETAGIGWAAGVERILLASVESSRESTAADMLVVPSDESSRPAALQIVMAARAAGLSARLEVTGRSTKASFKHAAKIGAQRVAIVEGSTASISDQGASNPTAELSVDQLIESFGQELAS